MNQMLAMAKAVQKIDQNVCLPNKLQHKHIIGSGILCIPIDS